jgi:hypothetical protein
MKAMLTAKRQAAVIQQAKVNWAAFFPGLAGPVEQKEGVGGVTGLQGATFEDTQANGQTFSLSGKFPGPGAGHAGQFAGSIGQVEGGKAAYLDGDSLLAQVF